MRIRNCLIAATVLSLAIPGFASAARQSPTEKATGGGQIFFNFETGEDDPVAGAGDTIAFTAQQSGSDPARGQVQFIDRTGGTGKGQVKLHGTVTCLEVDGNMARIGVVATRTDDPDRTAFEMLVIDNGEGVSNTQGDQIAISFADEPECGDDDDEDDAQTTLARGNVQVHETR